jgi:hypothetical protein
MSNDVSTVRNDSKSGEKVVESDALLSFKEGAFDAALIRYNHMCVLLDINVYKF